MKTNLGNVISKVRDELVDLDSKRRKEGLGALFQLSEVEIEVNFAVETSDTIKGGFDLKVISLGNKDEYKQQEIQKIKIKLGPASGENDGAPLGSRYKKGKASYEGLSKERVQRL